MHGPGGPSLIFAHSSIRPNRHPVSICQLMVNKIINIVAYVDPVR